MEMKAQTVALIVIELICLLTMVVLLLLLTSPRSIYDGELARATSVWIRNPSPENEAKLEEVKSHARSRRTILNVVLIGAIGLDLFAIVTVAKKIRRSKKVDGLSA